MCEEGVIRFEARHRMEALAPREVASRLSELSAWRRILVGVGALGRDPDRYGGAGFGNVSCRMGSPSSPRGRRALLITGTQTGSVDILGLEHVAVVTAYDLAQNRVDSRGPVLPSSESLTHGAIYDLSPAIRAVVHGHLPDLWRAAGPLRLPTTAPDVGYGTVEMAREVERLYRSTHLAEKRVFAMAGHEDGVIAFGKTMAEASTALLTALADAHRFGHATSG